MCSGAADGAGAPAPAPAPDHAFRGFVSHDRAEETPEAKAR